MMIRLFTSISMLIAGALLAINAQTAVKDESVAGRTSSSTANTTQIAKLSNITPKADGTVDLAFGAGINTQGNEKFLKIKSKTLKFLKP